MDFELLDSRLVCCGRSFCKAGRLGQPQQIVGGSNKMSRLTTTGWDSVHFRVFSWERCNLWPCLPWIGLLNLWIERSPTQISGLRCGLQECLRLWIKTNAQQGGIPRCPGGCTQKVSRPAYFFSNFEFQCRKFWIAILVHLFSRSSWDLLTPPSSPFQGSLSLATTLDLPTKGYGAIGTRQVGSENEGVVKRWKAGTLLLMDGQNLASLQW